MSFPGPKIGQGQKENDDAKDWRATHGSVIFNPLPEYLGGDAS
jgi:hypothetical protein